MVCLARCSVLGVINGYLLILIIGLAVGHVGAIWFAQMTSQCKRDALLLSYAPYIPSTPSGTLTMLRLASPNC